MGHLIVNIVSDITGASLLPDDRELDGSISLLQRFCHLEIVVIVIEDGGLNDDACPVGRQEGWVGRLFSLRVASFTPHQVLHRG